MSRPNNPNSLFTAREAFLYWADGVAVSTLMSIKRSERLLNDTAHMVDPQSRLIIGRARQTDGAALVGSRVDGAAGSEPRSLASVNLRRRTR